MQISFKATIPNTIDPKYKTEESKANTVTILGSSKPVDDILRYMDMCSNSTKTLILSGKNIVHGCGAQGIMGEAYKSGEKYSTKDENGIPLQNLAIPVNPLWGDEDLDHCVPLVCANSESERIEKFAEVSNTILIFPGSAGTLQEASTLISKNYYGKPEDKKQIVLVGKDFFKGLTEQYEMLYKTGLIKNPPEDLFVVADSEEEIINLVNKKDK